MRRQTILLAAILGGCMGDIGGESLDDPSNPGDPSAPPAGGKGGGLSGAAGSTGTPGATGTTGNPAPAGVSFACGSAKPTSAAWRRLSRNEYRNTLRDLLALGLKDAAAAATVLASLPLADLPDEGGGLHGAFSREQQDVSQEQVRAWYRIAQLAGRTLGTRERMGVLLGPCATDAAADNDGPCLTDFVRRFGERAFRRPLTEEEVTFYRGFHGAVPGVDPAGVADVLTGLLMAPPFVLLTEHGETLVAGTQNVYALSGFEIASRLSYQFWETMPDQALWDAARTGTLRTPEGYAKELDRVVADPRARKTLRTFFSEWLQVEEIPQLTTFNDDPVFKSFAGTDLPRTPLRDGLMQDVLDMVDYFVWDKGGSLGDLLTSNLVFPKSAELAKIYGVALWQGGEPPQVPADQRPGLLTRAAFLASGTANTRPINRGVFVRTGILCDEIPPPPNGNAPPLPPLSDKLTTRQTVELLTEAEGTACASCHKTLINPIGFAMESFDGLGRHRTEQRLFSRDGKEIGRAPVDTASIPQIMPGDQRPSRGVGDVVRQINESGRVPACLARNYFRFTHARREDTTADGCALEQSRKAFADASGGSLRSALREVALGRQFKERAF